ncbi:MAG: SigB/SigF/SigG family RNA polymerase sigma factor [Clostridia bacterium]
MLTNEETFTLLDLAKNGDNLAKEQLITINSPLIKSIIKRYLNKGVDYDDLYQLGALGFIKAINNYDPSFNVKFTTYAVPMIAGEIKRFLRDDGSVKVSRSIKHNAVIVKNYISEYSRLYNENPTLEKISTELKLDRNDIILALEANSSPLSLNEQYNGEDDSMCIMDRLADDFNVENMVNKLALREMISTLSAREKQVIIMRYYLDKTQSEIAKELGISQVQVSRIENKILLDMKNNITV